MLAVQRIFFTLVVAFGSVGAGWAQEPSAGKPQVKLNVLNVCTPSPDQAQEISSALERIPKHPAFGDDFEVDRGRSVLDPNTNPLAGSSLSPAQVSNPASSSEPAAAQFVRIRRDFPNGSAFSNVQYSFSRDSEQMVETLVLRVREPRDLLEISIESSASSVTSAAAMLSAETPAGRIKLERFGKSSVVLARCSAATSGRNVDQSTYEPLFSSASSILSDYRGILDSRRLVPEELARLSLSAHRRISSSSPRR
jgi:hypothetical protein